MRGQDAITLGICKGRDFGIGEPGANQSALAVHHWAALQTGAPADAADVGFVGLAHEFWRQGITGFGVVRSSESLQEVATFAVSRMQLSALQRRDAGGAKSADHRKWLDSCSHGSDFFL